VRSPNQCGSPIDLAALACVVLAVLGLCACTSASGVPVSIHVPTRPAFDLRQGPIVVSSFVSGGNVSIDAGREVARVLVSEIRAKTTLTVSGSDLNPFDRLTSPAGLNCWSHLKHERDVDACGELQTRAPAWTELAREHDDAFIVAGTIFFTAYPGGGSLRSRIVIIDGRTGAIVHTIRVDERIKAHARRAPLTWFFLLMDRVSPIFIDALRGDRTTSFRTLVR
jgi:hypothetical protein